MKTKLKFFLVLLAMLVGEVNSVWAENVSLPQTVGDTSFGTTTAGTVFSNEYSVAADNNVHLEFTNYHSSGDTNNDHNWLLYIYNVVDNPIVMRPNYWWFCGDYNLYNPLTIWDGSNRVTQFSSNIDWSNFSEDMNGASVSIDACQAGWYLIIRAVAQNNGRTHTETMKIYNDPAHIANIKLSVQSSYLVLNKAETKAISATYNDFTSGAPASNFSSTGTWQYVEGEGYRNVSSGTETFTINGLHNGDQVVITYTGWGTFNTTNAKYNTGDIVTVNSQVPSEEAFYITQDGSFTMNLTSWGTIQSVEIMHETETTAILFTSKQTAMNIGEVFQTAVSMTPTHATPTYESNATGVATIDANGRVTAVGEGSATITARLGSASDSYEVTVSSTNTVFQYEFRGFREGEGELDVHVPVVVTGSGEEGKYIFYIDFSSVTFSGSNKHCDGRFGVKDNGWILKNDGSKDGYYNGTTQASNLYIRDLKVGDQIKVWYDGTLSTTSNLSTSDGTANPITYTVESNGVATVLVGNGTYIQRIEITRAGSFAMSFDPTSCVYDLTDMDFTEPTLTIKVNNVEQNDIMVVYSSSDERIAKPNNSGDIYFIRPGRVTITAETGATINGSKRSASYDVIVRASEAIFSMQDEHTGMFEDTNPYSKLINTGVVAENAVTVTSIPFITMTFGNGDEAVVVRNKGTDASPYNAAMILDENGSEHMAYTPTDGKVLPTQGTYYVFRPVVDGTLTIEGIRKQNRNDRTVVLVDANSSLTDYDSYTVGANTYYSYPKVHTYTFSNDGTIDNSDNSGNTIRLTAGHTYYLYGNNNYTDDRQVFYLHGFKYVADFKFDYRGVVMDGGNNTVDSRGFLHVANASTFSQVASGANITYTCEYKDKAGTGKGTPVTIQSDGTFSVNASGSYVVTAALTSVGETYKTSYVLTKPYTLPADPASDSRISWEFRSGHMETQSQLNSNTDYDNEWATYYKVRQYDPVTKALTYINVPVRSNGVNVVGDNARFFDNTAGLLFKANAREFGTTAAEPANKNTLYEKLHCNPETELDDYKYVTLFNGSSITIPNLKAGQYVRIKWSRYSGDKGNYVTASNVRDLNNQDMDGVRFSVGAGGRVNDNGGNGYHEFKVKADGDVTFTVSQDGWINIYQVDVANKFIPTEIRLHALKDPTNETDTRGAYLTNVHKANRGDDFIEIYATNTGRAFSQSNAAITYHIKGDAIRNGVQEAESRTGTLNSTNCKIGDDNRTLTVYGGNTSGTTSGHGRFTLVQEGTVDGTYLLDRNEYEIKVYEYDYSYKQHPYTWNMENISTGTGTSLNSDKNRANNCWSQTTTQASANQYQLTLEPENMITWEYRNGSGAETAVRELDGLGIRPKDISMTDNTIVFSTNNGGVDLSGTDAQILTIPAVAVGETAYLRLEEKSGHSVSVKYADGTDVTPVETSLGSSYKTYNVAGNGQDIEFNLNNVNVKQVAVSKDTKTITAAGYATEARGYNLDFSLNETFGGSAGALTANKVTGVNGSQIILGSDATPYFPAMSSLSDKTGQVGTGAGNWTGSTGLCGTNFAPAVNTAVAQNVQMVEKFGYKDGTTTVNAIGDILSQIVQNLENGYYFVELYANAMTTADRTDDNISSDLVDGAMDVAYVFANNSEVPIVARRATSTAKNGEYSMVAEVTNGTLTLGLRKKKAGTNWHTIQIKSLSKVQLQGALLQGEPGNYPLFTWDVNRTTSDMTDNKLIGVSEVTANTPVLPQKDANGNYNYILANGGALIRYEFEGNDQDIDDKTGEQVGSVSGLGFYLVIKDGTILSDGTETYSAEQPNPHSAYLQLSGAYLREHAPIPSGAGVRQYFLLDNEDEATAVNTTNRTVLMNDDAYYSLQGVRVENPSKGLYVRGGKKVVIR